MNSASPEISFEQPSVADRLPKNNIRIFDGVWEPYKRFPTSRNITSPSPKKKNRRSAEFSPKNRRKLELSKQFVSMKGKTSVVTNVFPNFSIIFRIMKYFKKRGYYRSHSNLKAHHLHIINDQAIVLSKQAEPEKTHSSIWRPLKTLRKSHKILLDSFIYIGISNLLTRLLRMTIIKDAFEKANKCLGLTPLFNPNHFFKVIWDLFVFLVLLVTVFAYSLDRCFDLNHFDKSESYSNFQIIAIFILLIDILFTINTKIYVSGMLVENRVAILWNYIKRYLILDFPAISGLVLNKNQFGSYDFRELNLLIFLKILFCHPELAKRLRNALVKNGSTSETIYDLLSLASSIFLSGHIIACLWHFISYNFNNSYPEENCWLKERGILMKDWNIKYLHSIYWSVTTMLTVGYGDVTPKNENEILFNIWAMLFGCIIFGYSLNRIGEILRRRTILENINKEKANLLHNMARGMNLSSDLETKIMKYMEYFWEEEKKVNPIHETLIMNQLSSNLREQIYYETNVKHLSSIPIFAKTFSQKTLFDLANNLKKIRCPPEEYIYKKGFNGDSSLFIVLDGRVEIKTQGKNNIFKDTTWEIHKKNDYFGVLELFTNFPRRSSAMATEFSTFFQLRREDFLSVVSKNPDEYEKFCKIKDDLLLYQNQYALDLKCNSCGRVDHQIYDCPFLKYNFNKHTVIGRHLYRKKITSKRFKRNYSRSKSSLLELPRLNEDAKDLLENHADDEDFKNYLEQREKDATSEQQLTVITEAEETKSIFPGRIEEEKFDHPPSSSHEERSNNPKFSFIKLGVNNDAAISYPTPPKIKNSNIVFQNRRYLQFEKDIDYLDKLKCFKFYYPKSNSDLFFQKIQHRRISRYTGNQRTLNKTIID